ncbi:hypothetical protein R1flu_012815 [Riccia fluitans]|uniref:Uncharacterized protein n=1 Tax=Riccia fluitans TaxID=41844 RepID=A0ABD1ZCW5_9MARC
MFNFANELQNYIPSDDSENTKFTFYPSVYYANRSSALPGTEHTIKFLEVECGGAVEAVLISWVGPVPECAVSDDTSEVIICNGTSICEAAQVYTPDSINLESVQLACMNYPTEEIFAINQTQCQEMVDRFGMTTHLDFDKGRSFRTDSVNVCEAFSCKKVPAAEVYWANFLSLTGEIALSRMIQEPSFKTSYTPALCFNNYTDVFVQYKAAENEIQWIHQMNCTTLAKSHGCWPSGYYKFMTDTRNDKWSKYNFSSEDIISGKTMSACYRFGKKSYSSYMYDSLGIVAGIIGSWLLLLSCAFWIATKVFPSRSSEVATGSLRPSANGVQLTKL